MPTFTACFFARPPSTSQTLPSASDSLGARSTPSFLPTMMFTSPLIPLRRPGGGASSRTFTRKALPLAVRVGQDLEHRAREHLLRKGIEADCHSRGARVLVGRLLHARDVGLVDAHLQDEARGVADLEEGLIHGDHLAELHLPREHDAIHRRAHLGVGEAALQRLHLRRLRAVFAERSIRSARCCASFAERVASSCATRAFARSSPPAPIAPLSTSFSRRSASCRPSRGPPRSPAPAPSAPRAEGPPCRPARRLRRDRPCRA